MRKLMQASSFSISLLTFLSFAPLALAQTSQCPDSFKNLCNVHFENGGGIVGGIVQFIIILAVVACLGFMVWGGVRWISSGGDQAKIQQARSTIIAALVGLIIAVLGYFLVSVLVQIFTGQGLGTLPVPKLVP